jgi:hypothetical protein
MSKNNNRANTKFGNMESNGRAQRRIRHSIGDSIYTIFVCTYTALLLCAVVNPKILPLEYFRKFEHLPRDYDEMKLFWQSFGILDPVWYGLIYIVLTFGGYYFMLEREPLRLKWFQRCWNITVAVFSVWSALRSCNQIVKWLSYDGTIWTLRPLIDNICDGKISGVFLDQSPMAFYAVIFIFSKYFEYLDTFFLIVRKKPLITLHW